MKKYVRNIAQDWGYYGVYKGKVYTTEQEGQAAGKPTYYISTPLRGPIQFYQSDFEVVDGCPCGIKLCISKHKEESLQ
jgi:hypothetical protein